MVVLSAVAEARIGGKLGLGTETVMEGTDPPGSLLLRKEDSGRHLWCSDICVAAPDVRGCGKRETPCAPSVGLGGKLEVWIRSLKD